MLTLGGFSADRDADHPSAVEGGGGEIGLAGSVDPVGPASGVGVEGFAFKAGGMVADADSLERDRGDDLPIGGGSNLVGEPLGVGQIAANPGLEGVDAFGANQGPELQGPKASTEGDAPIPEVFDDVVLGRLEVTWVGRHHPDEVFGASDVIERAVERRAEPLVSVEEDRVGRFDAVPKRSAFGADHR